MIVQLSQYHYKYALWKQSLGTEQDRDYPIMISTKNIEEMLKLYSRAARTNLDVISPFKPVLS